MGMVEGDKGGGGGGRRQYFILCSFPADHASLPSLPSHHQNIKQFVSSAFDTATGYVNNYVGGDAVKPPVGMTPMVRSAGGREKDGGGESVRVQGRVGRV